MLIERTSTFAVPETLADGCVGILQIGEGQQRGRAQGWLSLDNRIEPIHQLNLVGAGMHKISFVEVESENALPTRQPGEREEARWSRTIGALGVRDVWRRLIGVHFGVIGVGRTGSQIALSLARLGAQQLTLIDSDVIEEHNLGEMGAVTDADIGRFKVEALASSLAAVAPALEAVTVPDSITRLRALNAVKACDFLFSCVDHDSARLALTGLATIFAKPLIDVATGIHGRGGQRQMGSDIRLTLPGESCLLCLGGLRDPSVAQEAIRSADAELAIYGSREWDNERTGSLASLNQIAAGIAMRFVEDLIAERIEESMWVRIEFDPSGRLAVTYPTANRFAACEMCRCSGLGDDGLENLRNLFQKGDLNTLYSE